MDDDLFHHEAMKDGLDLMDLCDFVIADEPQDHQVFPAVRLVMDTDRAIDFINRHDLQCGDLPFFHYSNSYPLSKDVLFVFMKYAPVMIITVVDEFGVVQCRGTILDLLRDYGWAWAYGPDVPKMSILSERWGELEWQELRPRGMCTSQVLKDRSVFVYFEALGPTAEDVRCFDGYPEGIRVTDADGVGYFASKKKRGGILQIPLSVRDIWIHSHFKYVEGSLSEISTYSEEMEKFSVWTAAPHTQSMKQLLDQFDPERDFVIIPADGVGIGSRIWKGKGVFGDLISTTMTDKRMVKETIIDTMRRGQAEDTKLRKIVVLAYCQQFASDQELNEMLKLPCFFIEANDAILRRVSGVSKISPGLFSNCPVKPVYIEDKVTFPDSLLYTENLLLGSYVVHSESTSLQYLMKMRPTAAIRYAKDFVGPKNYIERGEPELHLATTVAEAERYLKDGNRVYLTLIGREYTESRHLPFLAGNVELLARTVYLVKGESNKRIVQSSSLYLEVLDQKLWCIHVGESDVVTISTMYQNSQIKCYSVVKIQWGMRETIGVGKLNVTINSAFSLDFHSGTDQLEYLVLGRDRDLVKISHSISSKLGMKSHHEVLNYLREYYSDPRVAETMSSSERSRFKEGATLQEMLDAVPPDFVWDWINYGERDSSKRRKKR